jgi:hypothetical protein
MEAADLLMTQATNGEGDPWWHEHMNFEKWRDR